MQCKIDNLIKIFEKSICKIEKINSYVKIDKIFYKNIYECSKIVIQQSLKKKLEVIITLKKLFFFLGKIFYNY